MTFKFASQKLLNGLFEPEGIYLSPPVQGEMPIVQGWGEHAEFYGQWRYQGVPLKGHNGVDVLVMAETPLMAMDAGRVVEISIERGGYERYVKIEHRWGESIYANTGDVLVEAGQSVGRGETIALAPAFPAGPHLFHFAIRIAPFNRYDGWGGFTDPLPYLPQDSVLLPDESDAEGADHPGTRPPHAMVDDRPGLRRP